MFDYSTYPARVILSSLIGILLGFFILHPAAMFIVDFHGPMPRCNWNAFELAFSLHHTPMSIFFGLLGGVMGLLIGIINEKLLRVKKRLQLLEGILPICSFCKKIRDDAGMWNEVENYIGSRSEAKFSYRVCRDCAQKKNFPEIPE